MPLGVVDRPSSARWYLARIVGAGTDEDPYRAATADLSSSHAACIPTDADGRPKYLFALVQAHDHARLTLDVDHLALPRSAGTVWAAVAPAGRDAVLERIFAAFGLTLRAELTDTVGDVVGALGRALDGAHFEPELVTGA